MLRHEVNIMVNLSWFCVFLAVVAVCDSVVSKRDVTLSRGSSRQFKQQSGVFIFLRGLADIDSIDTEFSWLCAGC